MSMQQIEISILELGGGLEVLSGQPRGQMLLGKLIAAVSPQENFTVVFLNFKGVNVATASFLRSAILAFRDHCVRAKLNLYPVLANMNDDIGGDLKLVLESRADAFVVCELGLDGVVSAVRLIGSLDDIQQLTFEAVRRNGEADATTLKDVHDKEKGTEGIGVTGWNNRLASLAEKGLVVEVKRGRTKLYRPVLEFM
jgi:hypothetical protein